MADQIVAIVRRIDFEPKMELLQRRIYAHVFLTPRTGSAIDVYTEDTVLQAAFLAAWRPTPSPDCAIFPPLIEVEYEAVGGINKAIRVALDYDLSGANDARAI